MKTYGGVGKLLAIAAMSVASFSVNASTPESIPGEYVVKFKKEFSVSKMNTFRVSQQLGSFIKSTIPDGNLVVIKRAAFETNESVMNQILENEMVEYVEPNFIYRAEKMPNDPLLMNLWGIKNTGQKDSANKDGVVGMDIDAERAWDINTGSDKVLVAVIDTGIDFNHPDLKDNIWTNDKEMNGKAGVDDDANGIIDDIHGANFVEANAVTGMSVDDHGHGSHCSGTIGAKGNDGAGIVGVSWNVKLLGAKFLSAEGYGSLEGAIKAIDYSRKMGAKILSNSWGGGGFSQALKEAIERSKDAGALFVAAAGNDGLNNDTNPHYPSNYDVANVISVAAIDNQGNIARFSNYGKATVHLGAPGVNVYSSITGGKYDSWSGTSMATPHVSGIAALLWAAEPNLTNMQIKERILKTTKTINGLKNKVATNGLGNAFFALSNQVAPPDMNDPANWSFKSVMVSSKHPYASNNNEEYEVDFDSIKTIEVEVAGAKEMALFFKKFDTERTYDKVTLMNKAGVKIGEISGLNDESFSPVIKDSYVKLVFTSDDSVEKYGFDITKVHYR